MTTTTSSSTRPARRGIVRAALQVTDHLLLPLAPSMSEVKRVTPTLDVAAEVAVLRPIQLSLLFNRSFPTPAAASRRAKPLEGMGLHVLAAEVGRREAYSGLTAPSRPTWAPTPTSWRSCCAAPQPTPTTTPPTAPAPTTPLRRVSTDGCEEACEQLARRRWPP